MSAQEQEVLTTGSASEFEGSWRPKPGVSAKDLHSMSSDTNDIPSFLLTTHQV